MPNAPLDAAPFANAMARDGRWVRLRATPPRRFQVLGERASGTNVIRRILATNTPLKPSDALGWKHGFPQMVAIPDDLLVVCAIRAPEPWALSMHRRPWHAHPDLQALEFSGFIRAEWHSIVDRPDHFPQTPTRARGAILQMDRHPITGTAFPNLFALRSAKLAALAGMVHRACSVAYVQMERAVADPESFLDWITAETGTTRTGPLDLPGRRMGTRFTRAHVVEIPGEMSAEDRAFVAGALDLGLETAFGYGDRTDASR